MLIALALLGVLGLEDHEMKSGDNRAGRTESLRVFSWRRHPKSKLASGGTTTFSHPCNSLLHLYPVLAKMSISFHRGAPVNSEPFSTESYFQTQRPPPGLEEKAAEMYGFVERWKEVGGKKVVLVTASLLAHF